MAKSEGLFCSRASEKQSDPTQPDPMIRIVLYTVAETPASGKSFSSVSAKGISLDQQGLPPPDS